MIFSIFPLLLLVGWLWVWIVYKWTIYAFPCLVAFATAHLALATGAGWLGSFVVWVATALLVFGLMRALFAVIEDPALRIALALVYVAPTVWMAYVGFDGLSEGHVPSEIWRQGLCVFGALFAGFISFARLADAEA